MELKCEQMMLVVSAEEWKAFKEIQQAILKQLKELQSVKVPQKNTSPYITAKEFMAAVRICRSNFDKLVNRGKIMTIKKGRKVYVVASEVERYFRDVEV